MEYIGYALSFGAGWAMKTAFHQAITAIGVRILTSQTGKRRTLEMLAEGIDKMGRKP